MVMARKTDADPNGQRVNRRNLRKQMNARLDRARRRVISLIRDIPRTVVNFVQYDLPPVAQQDLRLDITTIIQDELETTPPIVPPAWWYEPRIELPYRQGALEQTHEINQQIAELLVTGVILAAPFPPQEINIDTLLTSRVYRDGLRGVVIENYGLIRTLSEQTAQQVINVINEGIQGGKPLQEIINDVIRRFDVAKSNASRIVNTEVNRAYTNARLDAIANSPVEMKVEHISALLPTTRPHHAARHRRIYTVEQQRRWWSEGVNRINCFLPGTVVQGRFKGGLKSFYSGKVIQLVTRDGRDLTITPNHKVMTNRGLVRAAEIKESDYLIAYSGKNKNSVRVTDLNVNQVDTTIEQVFTSLLKIGNTSMVRPVSIDFNGDEKAINEDIQRVLIHGELVNSIDTTLFKFLDSLKFEHTDPTGISECSFPFSFNRVFTSTSSFIRSLRDSFTGFFSSIFESVILRFRTIATDKAVFLENTVNNSSTDTKRFRETVNRLPINVTLDKVVRVNISNFSGHVYDLQERSGLMLANNIIASNCHCSVRSVPADEEEITS